MDIEIDNSHSLQTMRFHCVSRAYRNVVEQAESHCPVRFGVMARGPYAAEGGLHLATGDEIHSGHDGAGSPVRRQQAIRTDDCIRVDVTVAACRHKRSHRFEMMPRMHAKQLFLGHFRRVDVIEHIEEPAGKQSIFDGGKAQGIFRMIFACVMFLAIRVTDIGGRQAGIPSASQVPLSCLKVHDTNRI